MAISDKINSALVSESIIAFRHDYRYILSLLFIHVYSLPATTVVCFILIIVFEIHSFLYATVLVDATSSEVVDLRRDSCCQSQYLVETPRLDWHFSIQTRKTWFWL